MVNSEHLAHRSNPKAAAGKVGDDPAVWQLKNSAKVGGKERSSPGGE